MRALFRVTAWERASWWRRILGAVARVAALLVILDVLFSLLGPPVAIFFTARSMGHKVPGLWQTPKPLGDYSISDAPGTTLSYSGYQFEVPWNTAFHTRKTANSTATGGWVGIWFDSGQSILFIAPYDQKGLLSEIAGDPSLKIQNARALFGGLSDASPYDQYSALLNTTPSTIRPFGPRAEAARGMMLLMIKAIAPPGNLQSGVFLFQLPGKRGFQIGDPQKSTGTVALEVLDMQGRYVEIICRGPRNGVKFTQPELNRILATLQPVSADSPVREQATKLQHGLDTKVPARN